MRSQLFLILISACLCAEEATFKIEKHIFPVPDGFVIERVAGPPLVDRPIVAALDEKGRLYVADSSGSNDKVDKQMQDKPHRIVRLEDTNRDGRYDKTTVFADKMMFPEGVMWLDGSLYVSAVPSIWKLADTDGDGGGGKRDGLIHAVYGGVYGKVHDVIDDHKRTSSEVMPVLAHMGPAAPCGLTRYESSAFGREYEDNLFACAFNLHKVMRFVLEPDGATFKARDFDFVASDNTDFHPTDVIEDADGSLLVVDTGGWYKLCCPTSQLSKPDVLGAIYRVRKIDASRKPAPRKRATDEVWAATRAGNRAAVRGMLNKSKDPLVQQAALHAISLWRDAEAFPALIAK